MAIDPVIDAEMSLSFTTIEALDDGVQTMALELGPLPRPALFLAAKAFVQCRRRGGSETHVPPGISTGAHAAVEGRPLLTRVTSRFMT